MMIASISFKELNVISGKYRLTWEWIGEGHNGDYIFSDSSDEPLLRFSCDWKNGNLWEGIDSGSYCTLLPITTSRTKLKKYAHLILKDVKHSNYPNGWPKHALERWSWLGQKQEER